MREFKFRAWDGAEMHYKVCINHEGVAIKYGYRATDWVDDAKAGTPMQFTGLRDRNGNEIYEGDIVRVDDSVCGNPIDGDKGGVYKVEYCLPECAFILAQLDEESAISFNEVMEYEIIGNLYENPELLTGHELKQKE